jgi:arsenate reductase (thioredoxin)
VGVRKDAAVPVDLDPVTQTHVDRLVAELAEEFKGVFSPETVRRFADESLERLTPSARFNDFLPLLAHRFARERLQAFGQVKGLIAKETPEVLFVCVQNAGRSQIAAALLDHRSDGRMHVRSAGSSPAEEIDPVVVEALAERGIDVTKAFPKPLTDEVVRAADVVVTMGCGDACPIYPGKRYEDWEVEDPAGRGIDFVRRVRDDIDGRVATLLSELGLEPAATSG